MSPSPTVWLSPVDSCTSTCVALDSWMALALSLICWSVGSTMPSDISCACASSSKSFTFFWPVKTSAAFLAASTANLSISFCLFLTCSSVGLSIPSAFKASIASFLVTPTNWLPTNSVNASLDSVAILFNSSSIAFNLSLFSGLSGSCILSLSANSSIYLFLLSPKTVLGVSLS